MLRQLKSSARRVVTWLTFRSIRMASVGPGCVYKSLSSKFPGSENIALGSNVHIGPGALLDGAGGITIADGSILAPNVKIYSRSHNFDQDLQALPFDNVMLVAPVRIGRFVWIGTQVIILPGVTIGDGAVIGAGSVVAKDIPCCAVAVGNPARVVRYRDKEQFECLVTKPDAFVYERFGHRKEFRPKSSVERRTQNK